jgi:hypothetical protein
VKGRGGKESEGGGGKGELAFHPTPHLTIRVYPKTISSSPNRLFLRFALPIQHSVYVSHLLSSCFLLLSPFSKMSATCRLVSRSPSSGSYSF